MSAWYQLSGLTPSEESSDSSHVGVDGGSGESSFHEHRLELSESIRSEGGTDIVGSEINKQLLSASNIWPVAFTGEVAFRVDQVRI